MTAQAAFPRASGILLHPTSLPGGHGIGDFGAEARNFSDFLQSAGQSIWQMLPLGPTGYGDSPYQCFSAFAGNPLLISLDELVSEGLLQEDEVQQGRALLADHVDFAAVYAFKLPLLRKAAERYSSSAEFETFVQKHSEWLDDYALFISLKDFYGGAVWTKWDASARDRSGLDPWREKLRQQISARKFEQFVFFQQFNAIKKYANQRGIRLVGDLPIYVAHDSADVWANRELFQLEANGEPTAVSGVPPDYFSATGQRWGNPIYRWDAMRARGFAWWIERFRATFTMFDAVRLDHFRGFEAYWQSPANESTAANGKWIEGPGAELFSAVEAKLGRLPIVAENLGVITPGVEAIRERFGFPGMSILQFAFGNDPQAPDFMPHNYVRNRVAYTGTHDNDTVIGWWNSVAGAGSVRSVEDIRAERAFALEYLDTDGSEMNWTLIRTLMASVADTVIFPLQDVLGLGSEARMNTPATMGNNWLWRMKAGGLAPQHAARLREMAEVYERLAVREGAKAR